MLRAVVSVGSATEGQAPTPASFFFFRNDTIFRYGRRVTFTKGFVRNLFFSQKHSCAGGTSIPLSSKTNGPQSSSSAHILRSDEKWLAYGKDQGPVETARSLLGRWQGDL